MIDENGVLFIALGLASLALDLTWTAWDFILIGALLFALSAIVGLWRRPDGD